METFRIGPIRPPSEAASLLLQVTQGCTWNKCKFCNLYRHTRFQAYTIDSIKEDIDRMALYGEKALKNKRQDGTWDIERINTELSMMPADQQNCYYVVAMWLINGGKHVFLQDGNTLALSGGRLTEVLLYLRKAFPQIERITSYGRAENLSRVSAQEFAELKTAGLDRIHSGFESGSDEVLKLVNKGVTAEQQITAGRNIKAGGLELSVYFMPGLGGKELSRENAEGMAHVVSQVNPDFVRIRTAAVKPGTELYEDYEQGRFILCSDDEKVIEVRRLITETKGVDTRLVSDHIVNLLQAVKGSLATDKEKMLGIIDGYLELPERDRKLFQIARRMGYVISLKEMLRLDGADRVKLEKLVDETPDRYEWAEKMNALIGRYI
ncbi:radical SAM protein [Hominibacterium faecale]|uniref:radical SAM protein n=1 Tax=Hominibacterium faecale TaxID=2839743 RepID=UPI0022B2A16E|nr:radical SAM protein [Hominibacterium faecale]